MCVVMSKGVNEYHKEAGGEPSYQVLLVYLLMICADTLYVLL